MYTHTNKKNKLVYGIYYVKYKFGIIELITNYYKYIYIDVYVRFITCKTNLEIKIYIYIYIYMTERHIYTK